MSQASEMRRVLQQGLGLLAAAVACTAAGVWWASQPDGPDDIRIAAATLRSQSAELKLVSQAADRKLPPRFVRAHAEQLAKSIDNTRDDVDNLQPPPSWLPLAHRLQPVVRDLAREANALKARPRQPPSSADEEPRTEALARTEQALKR
jgi:hypothetical protein